MANVDIKNETKIVAVCNCSRQAFYECGGMAASCCDHCYRTRRDKLPANAQESNLSDVFYIEGVD